MPFSLINISTTFQSYINKALRGYLDIFYIIYLDDIIVYSERVEEHKEHVRKVLERLR
jgi:Reverse transcriptase (RNA-dependent DNA polymerase)